MTNVQRLGCICKIFDRLFISQQLFYHFATSIRVFIPLIFSPDISVNN